MPSLSPLHTHHTSASMGSSSPHLHGRAEGKERCFSMEQVIKKKASCHSLSTRKAVQVWCGSGMEPPRCICSGACVCACLNLAVVVKSDSGVMLTEASLNSTTSKKLRSRGKVGRLKKEHGLATPLPSSTVTCPVARVLGKADKKVCALLQAEATRLARTIQPSSSKELQS